MKINKKVREGKENSMTMEYKGFVHNAFKQF